MRPLSADSGRNYDYWEVVPQVGYDFGFASVGLLFAYSPDFFGGSDDAQYYEANVEVPLPAGFTLNALYGHQAIKDEVTFALPDYNTWSVGLSYDLGELNSKLANFSIGATYVDTDIDTATCGSESCDARGIIGISASF